MVFVCNKIALIPLYNITTRTLRNSFPDKLYQGSHYTSYVYKNYEGDSKSSRKSAAKFVIVKGNLLSLCML